jgi:hypothetical protein
LIEVLLLLFENGQFGGQYFLLLLESPDLLLFLDVLPAQSSYLFL